MQRNGEREGCGIKARGGEENFDPARNKRCCRWGAHELEYAASWASNTRGIELNRCSLAVKFLPTLPAEYIRARVNDVYVKRGEEGRGGGRQRQDGTGIDAK